MTNDDSIAYQRYVDELRHEDSLINHRLTWLLMSQTLLFGVYGFSRSQGSNDVDAAQAATVVVIPFVGMLIATAMQISIYAAVLAFRMWHKELCKLHLERNCRFPQKSRNVWPMSLGHFAAHVTPLIFIGSWWVIFTGPTFWNVIGAGVVILPIYGVIVFVGYRCTRIDPTG